MLNILDKTDFIAAPYHNFSYWVSLFVVGDDSPMSNVTGGWIDKTKDQINSFSHRLIAQWEPKVFYYRLWSNF